MILGPDKARLSKRHGATSVMAYKDMGYLPEALVNYLVRLGWSHGDQEIFSMEEMVQLFDLDAVGKSAAVFNPEKLLWLNQHYIREYQLEKLAAEMPAFFSKLGIAVEDGEYLEKVVTDLKPRAKTLVEMAESGVFYFVDDIAYDPASAAKFLNDQHLGFLQAAMERLSSITDYTKEGIEIFLRSMAEEQGVKLKEIAQPLRIALTGKTVSPGLDEIMITLGKDKTIHRIHRAIDFIQDAASSKV